MHPHVLHPHALQGARSGSASAGKTLGHGRLLPRLADASETAGPETETCIVFPLWRQLQPLILPLLRRLLGERLGIWSDQELARRVWRLQLNRLPAGSAINPHVDQGSYVLHAHRIHVPLIVPRCVQFAQLRPSQSAPGMQSQVSGVARAGNWSEVPMKEGEAFEVNNKITHRVSQSGPYERVTLVLDVAEAPCKRYVEVSRTCASWDDPGCVTDFDVTPDEWLSRDGS